MHEISWFHSPQQAAGVFSIRRLFLLTPSFLFFRGGEAKFMVCGPIGNRQASPGRNRTLQPMVGSEGTGDHEPTVGRILAVSICAPTLASRVSSHRSARNRRPVGGDC